MQLADFEWWADGLGEGDLKLESGIPAEIVAHVAPHIFVLAHHAMEPIDELAEFVAAWADGLEHFSDCVRIFHGVDDTLGEVAAENWLLDGAFAFVPEREEATLSAPNVSVVSEEAIFLPVDVWWSEDDGVGEFLANGEFSVVFAAKELASLWVQQRLWVRCRV